MKDVSVETVRPGVVSVLLGTRSFTAHVVPSALGQTVWINGRPHTVAIDDPRDRAPNESGKAGTGPLEVRAQMPGKVIKVLVEKGASVEAGVSLLIIEAMKMQNEMKTPRAGRILQIFAREGAVVGAGEKLMILE